MNTGEPLRENSSGGFGKGPTEKDPNHGHLAGGLFHSAGGHAEKDPTRYLAAWPTRHTTGLNVQVACTVTGQLAWISDPIDGSRHDTYCLNESGVLADKPENWIGDKGYVGNNMLTPIKKPAHRDLTDREKEFNKQINKIRYVIDRAIANFKIWRIMHTDYRRPLGTFTQTISTVIALHFYKLAWSGGPGESHPGPPDRRAA